MKLIGVISTAVLSLILAAPVYAQEQHDQEEQKAKPEENKAQPEKSAKPEEKNAKQEQNTKPEEKNAQQAKPAEPAQRAGGNRIPDARYKANFGQGHTFRVNQGDYNNHRFQYGGYSFGFVGAWPGNWLYTQNVYVVDIDGVYYLCNPMYPGVNVELSVAL
jgi:sortase (surface protein transpeptidase)